MTFDTYNNMKKIFWTLFTFIFGMMTIQAQKLDSIANKAIEFASENNLSALCPIYKQYKYKMPKFAQLYCEIAITNNEGNYERMIVCIDSLKNIYPKKLNAKTQLSLSEMKAEGLRQLDKYEELHKYVSKEIKTFKRRRFKGQSLRKLLNYQKRSLKRIGDSPRAKLLRLADTYRFLELDSLYRQVGGHMDRYTQLRCKLTLSYAFHDKKTLLQTTRNMLEQYADSLDALEFSFCVSTHADLLARAGRWQDLGLWTQEMKTWKRTNPATIHHYEILAKELKGYPATSVSFLKKTCIIPTTYEWPLLFSVKINNGQPTTFTLDSEHPYTLISRECTQHNQIEVLPDTLQIATNNGWLNVSPCYIKKMQLGNLTIQHLQAYVVVASEKKELLMPCSLGLNEIMSFKHISILPEQIILSDTVPDTSDNMRKNLFISRDKGLRLACYAEQNFHALNLNISYPNNFLSRQCFPNWLEDSRPYCTSNGMDIAVASPFYIEEKGKFYDGILGMPFIRSYQKIDYDFENMQMSVHHETDYQPSRGNFSHDTDKHYLERNETALKSGNYVDPNENTFLDLLLSMGKNKPEQVVRLSRILREQKSDFYDCYTEAEGLFLNGEYTKACNFLKEYLTSSQPDEKQKTFLNNLYLYYKMFSDVPPITLEGTNNVFLPYIDESKWVEIKADGKKIEADFNLFATESKISIKSVKKYNVKLLGQHNQATYGILPQIECGNLTLKNIPCRILTDIDVARNTLPDKGKGILLGWNTLRHLERITLKKQGISLNDKQSEYNEREAAPMFQTDGWYLSTTSCGHYPTYKLEAEGISRGKVQAVNFSGVSFAPDEIKSENIHLPYQCAGILTMPDIWKKAQQITFDLKEMKFFAK